ncbi:S8 family peptidase [Altibacter sp. HG106]|uniref:S8 family peptidase n=1 Tax=Altibacter sp. HG106 TaxID=3023937 RepID=UPI0023503D0B|nr:S8/S53 family peptidase [Altibacter sp. HG106]MDC7996126.1 S8/S53 family peptidase [Altibacter sp. HG106]
MRKRVYFLLACCLLFWGWVEAQEETWFYLRTTDSLWQPEVIRSQGALRIKVPDPRLQATLDAYNIHTFRRTAKNAGPKALHRTFFVRAKEQGLLSELIEKYPQYFESGSLIPLGERRIFEPNDYGSTSILGANTGLNFNNDYLDYLGLPQAWYYTTGEADVAVGIADAVVDTTNLEFKGKTTVFRKAVFANGHGSGVAAIAAAQGDNGYGVPGLCYDCSIYATNHGDFRHYEQLMELSKAGVPVINCSWVSSMYHESAQDSINKMFRNGTIIVAGAGNRNWTKTQGRKFYYPASYEHVISVSSGMYKYESPQDNIRYEPSGNPYVENISGYVSRTAGFIDHDINNDLQLYTESIATLNPEVDLLAPSVGVFRFSRFVTDSIVEQHTYQGTSTSAPFVTGTIGLMFSLAPCLPVDEVESILKMTSTNIDHLKVNKPFKGNYGAGMLHTGRAVEMVYTLLTPSEETVIENQQFSRWKFKITALSKRVHLRNQTFTEASQLALTARKKIVIGRNTVLRPNAAGKIRIAIDPELQKQCDLRLRDSSILTEVP